MFLAALLLTSQFVPNPKYGLNTLIGRHQSWIPAAEALPADTFTKVFVMPNMHYARGLGRALGLPGEFRTAHGYRCDGLEGLLLLHARLGTCQTWEEMTRSAPFNTVQNGTWSASKMSSVFQEVSEWIDMNHGVSSRNVTPNPRRPISPTPFFSAIPRSFFPPPAPSSPVHIVLTYARAHTHALCIGNGVVV